MERRWNAAAATNGDHRQDSKRATEPGETNDDVRRSEARHAAQVALLVPMN
jgi:hypothetical protein